MSHLSPRERLDRRCAALLLALLAGVPFVTGAMDAPFQLDLATRIVVLALAAASLNLILGFGGMISFGHAAYVGIGAYAMGICTYYEVYSAWIQLPIAIGGAALFALVTGVVCLRTRGVHFIMITLAFAQMVYFAFVSIEEYGGDDGLVIELRSEGLGLDLESNRVLFWLALAVLALTLGGLARLVRSRFGLVLQGIRQNEERMTALGYDTFRYRLASYVMAGSVGGFAGWLLANFTSFISPEMIDWTRSGELIFMVVLGGAATVSGPLLGALAFIVLEELLSGITVYWQLIFGPFLILVVLFFRGGLLGGLDALWRRVAPPGRGPGPDGRGA